MPDAKKSGFTEKQLVRFLRVRSQYLKQAMMACGVERRVRYLAGDGKPIWWPISENEARKLIQWVRAQQGKKLLR